MMLNRGVLLLQETICFNQAQCYTIGLSYVHNTLVSMYLTGGVQKFSIHPGTNNTYRTAAANMESM